MNQRSRARDRDIFHITHIRNLPGIVAKGRLFCDSEAASQGLIQADIGMPSIKSRRRTTVVTCGAGGTPADYVPFYFAPRSPMLYSISRGNVPMYADGQEPVIYLVSSVMAVRAAGLRSVFTEGNAGAGFVQFREDDETLLEASVDWPLMRERYWKDTPDDPGRANRRQAEYLVHHSVPVSVLRAVVAKNQDRAAEAKAILETAGFALTVSVRPGWYY